MTRRLEALGDRLLGLMVPKAQAGACYTWTESCRTCYYRECYHCPGGPSGCGSCKKWC